MLFDQLELAKRKIGYIFEDEKLLIQEMESKFKKIPNVLMCICGVSIH